MDNKRVFAKNLNKYLKLNNLNQKQLSQLLNVNKSSVSQWTNGLNLPHKDTIINIAKILNITIDDLFNNDTNIDLKSNTLTVDEAAALLKKSKHFIRKSLQDNNVTWGFATKTSSKYSYCISKKKLLDFLQG